MSEDLLNMIRCEWPVEQLTTEELRDLFYVVQHDLHLKWGQCEAILQELGVRGETT